MRVGSFGGVAFRRSGDLPGDLRGGFKQLPAKLLPIGTKDRKGTNSLPLGPFVTS